MLCQSMIGITDDIIISDYHLSEKLLDRTHRGNTKAGGEGKGEGSAAATTLMTKTNTSKGKLSREIFSGSPAEVMVSTLSMIREKYGSINGYLDSIGFDSGWRDRFVSVAIRSQESNEIPPSKL